MRLVRAVLPVITLGAAVQGFQRLAQGHRGRASVQAAAVDPRTVGVDASLQSVTSAQDNDSDDRWIKQAFESQLKDDVVVGPDHVLIYDTTLRDGTQGESVSASCDDKIKIAKRIMAFGVDYVEAGWPGSNPKDAEFFQRSKTEFTADQRSKLVAFGSTRRKHILAQDDTQLQALLDSDAPTLCLVAKSHAWQVEEILKATREENVAMIYDSVHYLVSTGRRRVMVDLEHFFDGYKADPEYVTECCRAAVDAGASCLVLCDTNGGSMPWEVQAATQFVVQTFSSSCTVGIHAHNDCGMAVANSIVAAKVGAGLIQGTMNGIGERTGNADLCTIVPSLALHVSTKMGCKLKDLTTVSRFVDELLNRTPQSTAPFVGASAFAHKGGLHVAAMERNPLSYQHIDPALVGNEPRFLISELSGRQNIMGKMKEAGIDDADMSDRALAILERVKTLEAKGYTFEGAEASVHLMILHASKGYCSPFQVLDYSAQVYDTNIDSSSRVVEKQKRRQSFEEGSDDRLSRRSSWGPTARATIKVRTLNLDEEAYPGDSSDNQLLYKDHLEVSDGSGPVDALAKALKQALLPSHPIIQGVELVDYKVRILDPQSATNAATRVMIEFRNGDTTWTTVSVDRNIISASVNALVDGFEYALIEYAQSCMLCEDAF